MSRSDVSADDNGWSVEGWLLLLVAVALPIGAAIQFRLPIGPTRVSVTGSDLVVVLALSFLPLVRGWNWRLPVECIVPRIAIWLIFPTIALLVSLGLGLWLNGFQSWSVVRVIGWIVILAHVFVAAWLATDELARRIAIGAAILVAALSVVPELIAIFANTVFKPPETCKGWITETLGFMQNANAFGFLALIGFAVGMCRLPRGIVDRNGIDVALMSFLVFAMILSAARAAWLAAIVVTLLGLATGWTSRLRLLISIAVGIGCAFLLITVLACYNNSAVGVDMGALTGVVTGKSADDSNVERFETYRRAIELFLAQPIFGAGLGAYLKEMIDRGHPPLIIHSTPMWILAEMGLVGVLAFAAFAGATLIALISQIRRGEGAVRENAKAAFVVVVAFGVMAMAHELLYQRIFWVVLAVLLFRPVAGTDGLLYRDGRLTVLAGRWWSRVRDGNSTSRDVAIPNDSHDPLRETGNRYRPLR